MRYLLVLLIACTLFALGAQIAAAQPEADAGPAPAASSGTTDVVEAQPAAPPDIESDPFGSIEKFVDAVKTGNWKMVGALALALIMLILAKVRDKVAFFRGDRGGAILAMLLGLAGGLSAALAANAPIDWKLLLGIVSMTWTAVGGYSWIKRLVWPKDDAPTPIPVADTEKPEEEPA
jgi:hypothetical protein